MEKSSTGDEVWDLQRSQSGGPMKISTEVPVGGHRKATGVSQSLWHIREGVQGVGNDRRAPVLFHV